MSVKCEECGKEFNTTRQLNGHKRVHNKLDGSYDPLKRPKKIHKFKCLYCGIEKNYNPRLSGGKYCSSSCQASYKWENITKPRIEAGECSSNASIILKKYLIEIFGEFCSECSLGKLWNNKPLSLQLDHIDGDSDNNLPVNLRLLCPNCHTQTPTFGSKGMGSRYKKSSKRNDYLRKYKE